MTFICSHVLRIDLSSYQTMLILRRQLKLTSLLVGDNTLVGGNDSNTQTAQNLGQSSLPAYTRKPGLEILLIPEMIFSILVCTVLSEWMLMVLKTTIFNDIVLLNISLHPAEFCAIASFILDEGTSSCIVFCSICITNSCKHICDRIAHCHDLVSSLLFDLNHAQYIHFVYTIYIIR